VSQPSTADVDWLRWRCRRGMRELDLLLERYLARDWPAAAPERRAAFVALLELPDPELAALCLGLAAPPDAGLASLLADVTYARRGDAAG
jgi:antitoxin CptB